MASTTHAQMRQGRACLHTATSKLPPRPLPRSLACASQRSDSQTCRPCRDTRCTIRAEKHDRSSHQGHHSSIGRQLLGLTAAGVMTFAAGTADQCSSRAIAFNAHIEIPVEIAATAFLGSAWATNKVGEFEASGFIFKDSVEAVSVEDPEGIVVNPNCSTYTLHRMLILQSCFYCSQRGHNIHLGLPQVPVRQAKQRLFQRAISGALQHAKRARLTQRICSKCILESYSL